MCVSVITWNALASISRERTVCVCVVAMEHLKRGKTIGIERFGIPLHYYSTDRVTPVALPVEGVELGRVGHSKEVPERIEKRTYSTFETVVVVIVVVEVVVVVVVVVEVIHLKILFKRSYCIAILSLSL